jgi:hypothetical protein
MKKLVLALAAAASFAAVPSFALAADAQSNAAVKALFDAMEIRKTLAASYVEMEKTVPAMMREQIVGMIEADPQMNAAQKKESLARLERMLPGVAEAMVKTFRDPAVIDEMIAEMAPLYANNYTADELRQLAAFYKTPVGRKTMQLTPRLTAESMAIGQRIMMPRIGKMMQDMVQELQKH